MSTLTQSPAWIALQTHQPEMATQYLRDLFEQDSQRFDKFSLLFNDIPLDYSKQLINGDTVELLLALARQQKMEDWITRMFSGDKINSTENRAALHGALRCDHPVMLDGEDIIPEVKQVLQQMSRFTAGIRSGERKGFSGKVFTDVVNIGIGGSDLGVIMVTEALKPYATSKLNSHFISNIDGAHITEILQKIDPETTLFIIASKTFTTKETITNAHFARQWFLSNGGCEQDIARHFVAVSANRAEVEKFGISPDNLFMFWDWVGVIHYGRPSVYPSHSVSVWTTFMHYLPARTKWIGTLGRLH